MNIKRFYKKTFPDADDIVMAKIINENEYGYNCLLLEYDNLEGFLSSSELVKGKYVKKHLLKEGETLSLVVLKTDENKKIVELSKKRVKDNDKETMTIKYKTCSNINRLVNECYVMYLKYCDISKSDIIHTIEELMNDTVWKFYEEEEGEDASNDKLNYDTIYKNILANPSLLFPHELFEDDFVDKAKHNIQKRIIKNNMTTETDLSLLLMEENAVSKLKSILDTSAINYDGYKINVTIISPPHYKIRIEGQCPIKGSEILNEIKNSMVQKASQFQSTLQFEKTKMVSESSYEIKFLADFDLERLELV